MKLLTLLMLLFVGACAQASNGSDLTDAAMWSPAQSAQPHGVVAMPVDCSGGDPAQSRCGLAGRGTQW